MTATKTAGMIISDEMIAQAPVKDLLYIVVSDLVSQIGYRLETEKLEYAGVPSNTYKLVPQDIQE